VLVHLFFACANKTSQRKNKIKSTKKRTTVSNAPQKQQAANLSQNGKINALILKHKW